MEDRADSELGLKDYAGILRRRAKPFLLIALPIITIASALAFRLPPVYESSGVLLVEQSPISEDLVRSTVSSTPDERVRRITERVLVEANLAAIVAERNPYPELDSDREAVRELRRNVVTAPSDPQMLSQLVASNPNLIAFRVGMLHGDPMTANAIADDLIALYLEENQEARQELAEGTLTFLENQALRLEERINEQEQVLADFKRENAGRLPELSNMNMQLLDRTERDLQAAETEIRALRERIALLESELGQISPYAPVFDENGVQILSAVDRLKVLQRRYAQDSANYGPDHPDLVRMRAEIDSLAAQTGLPGIDRSILETTLAGRQRELENLRELGRTDEHPDVRRTQLAIDNLQAALAEAPRTTPRAVAAAPPDNPQYIRTEVQLRGARTELDAALARRDDLRERLLSVEQRLTATPEVDREYQRLSRGYEQLIQQYNEVLDNMQDVSMSASLASSTPGERFSVLRAPNMPRSPAQPNRIAILLLGFVVAFMGGAAAVAAAELMDSTVRSPRDVTTLLEIPPLVMIPFIENDADAKRRRWARAAAATGVLLWVGVTAFFFMTPAGQ